MANAGVGLSADGQARCRAAAKPQALKPCVGTIGLVRYLFGRKRDHIIEVSRHVMTYL